METGVDDQASVIEQRCALSTALSVEIVIGWIHWIVNVSNCKELWIARRKRQHLQTAGKDH